MSDLVSSARAQIGTALAMLQTQVLVIHDMMMILVVVVVVVVVAVVELVVVIVTMMAKILMTMMCCRFASAVSVENSHRTCFRLAATR